MQTTGMSRGDGVLAVAVALAVNALVAWQLQALLAPPPGAGVAREPALQVVWIATVPRRTASVAPSRPRTATAAVRASRGPDRPPQMQARPDLATAEAADPDADPRPARPMTAVYLQQAGQWAQDHPATPAPADPFASRPVALADQPASRFRLKRPLSVADAVAMVGLAFGNPPHPCLRNPDDVAGHATGRDTLALQMALDVDRQCRP